jgi:hypothetical protein
MVTKYVLRGGCCGDGQHVLNLLDGVLVIKQADPLSCVWAVCCEHLLVLEVVICWIFGLQAPRVSTATYCSLQLHTCGHVTIAVYTRQLHHTLESSDLMGPACGKLSQQSHTNMTCGQSPPHQQAANALVLGVQGGAGPTLNTTAG